MKKTYSEKLKDPRWQKKRLEVFNRDGFTCQLCSDKESILHVHHKSYSPQSEPWDYELDNFQTLCYVCHAVVEQLKSIEHYVPYKALKYKHGSENNGFIYVTGMQVESMKTLVEIFSFDSATATWLIVTGTNMLTNILSLDEECREFYKQQSSDET